MKRILTELAWLIAVVALVAAAVFGPGMVLGSQPALSEPVVDRVDLVEVNHFFDEQGRLVFDQVIFYDWRPSDDTYIIEEDYYHVSLEGGGFVTKYFDGQSITFWQPEAIRVPREREESHPWQCVAWRLVKNPAQLPYRATTGEYHAVWNDGEVMRKVVATHYRESWTQHDPELWEREFLAKEGRRELKTRKLPPAGALRPNPAQEVEQ
jgi:hypothetical protein